MNIVQNRVAAELELRAAHKALRNFELLSKGLNDEITRLHGPGLKSARAELEAAKKRFDRAKELVKVRIKLINASQKLQKALHY